MSKKERLTDEELFAQLEGLGNEETGKKGPKPAPAEAEPDADLLEELRIPERPKAVSRPHTPRLQSTSTTPANRSSPKRTATPSSNDGTRSSEEKPLLRKSAESSRSFHNSFTPASTEEAEAEPEKSASVVPEAVQAQNSGGGWWGGIFSTASAAVKQAESLAKEIRQNEEAQRWAEQVKGNVGALRGLGNPFITVPTIVLFLTFLVQAANCDQEPCLLSRGSSTLSLHRSPPTNAYRSTSLTTSSAIHPSTT